MTSELDQLASRQYGLATVLQLHQLGLGQNWISNQVATGRLFRVRRRVYRLAGAQRSWHQAVLSAALAAGDDATISHATAAAVWDLKHSDRSKAGIHITAVRHLRIRGVTAHRRQLMAGERTSHQGVAVTTPERTLIDLASIMTSRQLAECVDDALRRRLISLSRLRRLVERTPSGGQRSLAPIRQVLADRPNQHRPGDSDWEQRMDRLWDRLGLPPAQSQYEVTVGRRTYRLDRAIPDLKIGVEWNGFDTHGTRSAFDRDSDRQADLTTVGWHIIPFTSNSTAERIAGAVLQAVHDRGKLQRGPAATTR